MAQTDSRGLPLSTDSDLTTARFRDGIGLMLSAWPGVAERLDAAIATEVVRAGVSGAQRELVEDMLLLSLMRGGAAGALPDRQLHRRPSPRDTARHGQLAA